MSDLVEIKKSCDALGVAFEAFKTAAAEERKAGSNASGEVKEKLVKIEANLLKFEETKTRLERAMVAMQATDPTKAADGKAAEYRAKIDSYLRKGRDEGIEAARAEVKAMSALSGPEGGYWLNLPEVDPTFRADVVESSPMRQLARVLTISGPSIKGKRRATRTSTGGWVGEADSRPTTATGTLGEWEIVAREMYAYPEAPQSFLDDAAVNVEAWLNGEVSSEFEIIENTAFVSGNGVKRPMGFNAYPATDPGTGAFIEAVNMGASNALAADDLINLQEALKEPYQGGATFAFKRVTLSLIRKLVTSSQVANYLWQPGLQAGVPGVILGRPYVFMDDLPAVSAVASTYPIHYGDFRACYTIVDRQGVTVLRDPITNKGFVGFYTVKRTGGDVVHFEGMKRLANI